MSRGHLRSVTGGGSFRTPDANLENGGGGGNDGGMEARVAKLESDVSHIQADVGEVRSDLRSVSERLRSVEVDIASIKERLSHMPTTVQMWVAVAAVTIPVGGVMVGILTWVLQNMLQPLLKAAS